MPVRLRTERGPHRGLSAAEVERRARAMMRALQIEEQELSIVLTDDEQIRKLNATFRGFDRPTDVLAFAMREGEGGQLAPGLLGDVVLSVQTARAQALRAGKTLLEEATMLLAHGLLHLLGYDHDTRAKDVVMRRETARLCARAERGPGKKALPRAASSSRPRGAKRRARGVAPRR